MIPNYKCDLNTGNRPAPCGHSCDFVAFIERLSRPEHLINPKEARTAPEQGIQNIQASVTAKTPKMSARRKTMSAQNPARFQVGGTVPFGLLHPPRRSSSTVKRSPANGQTKRNNKAAGATGQSKKTQTTAVSAAPIAIPHIENKTGDLMGLKTDGSRSDTPDPVTSTAITDQQVLSRCGLYPVFSPFFRRV